MDRVTSKDGTSIAFERAGAGPTVILVGGGLDDGSENEPLVPELAEHFTVVNYARRGRAESGDRQPYGVAREIDDLESLIAETGGAAHLYGVSSGGALALEATAAGIPVDRLAVYEVPYMLDDEATGRWQEYVDGLQTALDAGDRDEALVLFMRVAGASEEDIAGAKSSPYWAGMQAVAPTLAYDAACLGDGRPPTERLATITRPTLVLTGTALHPAMQTVSAGFFDAAADAIAASIPNGERQTLEGQTHVADPKVVAPVLGRFFTA